MAPKVAHELTIIKPAKFPNKGDAKIDKITGPGIANDYKLYKIKNTKYIYNKMQLIYINNDLLYIFIQHLLFIIYLMVFLVHYKIFSCHFFLIIIIYSINEGELIIKQINRISAIINNLFNNYLYFFVSSSFFTMF